MNLPSLDTLPSLEDIERIYAEIGAMGKARREPLSIAVVLTVAVILGGGVGLHHNIRNGSLRWSGKSTVTTETHTANQSPAQQDNDPTPLSQGE